MSFGVGITLTALTPIEPGALAAEDVVMKAEGMIRAALGQSPAEH